MMPLRVIPALLALAVIACSAPAAPAPAATAAPAAADKQAEKPASTSAPKAAATPAPTPKPTAEPTPPMPARDWTRVKGSGFSIDVPEAWQRQEPKSEEAKVTFVAVDLSTGNNLNVIATSIPKLGDPTVADIAAAAKEELDSALGTKNMTNFKATEARHPAGRAIRLTFQYTYPDGLMRGRTVDMQQYLFLLDGTSWTVTLTAFTPEAMATLERAAAGFRISAEK